MNHELAIAIQEARKALEKLQEEIKNEVVGQLQEPATNDLLVRASQNHIHKAQIAIDRVGNHLVSKINERIEKVSR